MDQYGGRGVPSGYLLSERHLLRRIGQTAPISQILTRRSSTNSAVAGFGAKREMSCVWHRNYVVLKTVPLDLPIYVVLN